MSIFALQIASSQSQRVLGLMPDVRCKTGLGNVSCFVVHDKIHELMLHMQAKGLTCLKKDDW